MAGVLPVGFEPPWVGRYAWKARPGRGCRCELVPAGVWARWLEARPGVHELVLPGGAGAQGRGRGPGLSLPDEVVAFGVDVGAGALWRGRWVDVVDVDGDAVLVVCDGGSRLVGRDELERVTMDAYRVWVSGDGRLASEGPGSGRERRLAWRAVLPSADRACCDGLAGAWPLGRWPSPFVGPVPASGEWYAVVGATPFLGTSVTDRDGWREGPLQVVMTEGWAPWPAGIKGGASYFSASWSTGVLDQEDVDGVFHVDRVTASWRGRRVEVGYVAYAYAYVVEHSNRVNARSRVRVHDERPFAQLEGPVRLDELYDISFDVFVRWRSPGSPSWPFLEVWGLEPELTSWATARMERGGWPAWPWRTVADGTTTQGGYGCGEVA